MANTVTIEVQAHGEKALDSMRKSLISLAPAAVPVAAALGTVAAQVGAAGVATAAFGAAVVPQVKAVSDLAKSSGQLNTSMSKVPSATQAAAASFTKLNNAYQEWSDSLAGDTMPVVTKAFQTMTAVLPNLSGMVKGAAGQFDRLMNVIGGGVAGGAFEGLMKQLTDVSNNALKSFTDQVVHLSRALSEGQANGPLQKFIEYAKSNGPAVKDTLTNVAKAVGNLLQAAAAAGPSMLTIVNALAKMVTAIPAEFLGVLLKVYTGFKLITTVRAGLALMAGTVTSFATSFGAAFGNMVTALFRMRFAAQAAGGGLAGLRAAFSSLSGGAQIGVVAAAIGALILTLHELSDNKAPVEVDALKTSLDELATTGKVTGTLSTNFDQMTKSIAMMSKGASDNSLLKLASDFGTFIGIAKGPSISDAAKDLDAWDKAMAENVRSGNTKLAAAQFEILKKAWKAGHGDLDRLKDQTDDYHNALQDQAHEQKLAAEAMGIFGQSAQDTSAKLETQKAAADGLKASIIALNEVNRSAYDAQINFEASLDSLDEAFKKNGANLDLSTKAGQENGRAMSAAAKSQDELIASGLAAGESLESMTGKSQKLRMEMLRLATDAFDGNKKRATEYVNTLLGAPSEIKTFIKLERESAISGLKDVQAEIAKTPGAKSVKVDTLNAAAIAALEKVGLKTKQLPDGRTQVYTANGQALGSIGAVAKALRNLDGKTANTWTFHHVQTKYSVTGSIPKGTSVHDVVGATGGAFTGKAFRYSEGGTVTGPGTSTSDDVFAPWLSAGEFVMKKTAVDKYGEKFMMLLNQGKLDMPRFAKGGKVSKAEREARNEARGDLTISHFGVRAGYKNSEFRSALGKPADISSLVNALNQWRSVILKSTHGAQESKLLKQLDKAGSSLLKYEKKLNDVNKSLDKAKTKLDDLKQASSQLKDSVKSGLMGEANITKAANASDSQVTINTLLGQMGASAANTKQFSQMLADLKKKGVSGDLISQIAEAGIEGGGMETAAALLGGSKADIKRINDYQKQIGKSAGNAGKTAADAMYGAGIKAAEGLVKGLEKKRKDIEKAMMNIAKSMEKAIKHALGIKSPSKVMEEVGHFTAEGFAVGMRKNKSVKPAWASMLNVPHGAGGARSVAYGGHAVPVVLEIRSGGSKVDDLVVEIIRKSVRTKGGGNVQTHLGQR